MAKPRMSVVVSISGFGLLAVSVLMAFLSDHHWLITYNLALAFESYFWWVHLVGLVLAIPGSVGLCLQLSRPVAFRTGAAFLIGSLLLLLLSGGPKAILNVHDWKIVLILPLLLSALVGLILFLVGGRRESSGSLS